MAMSKITRRKHKQDKDFLLQKFTTLLLLITQYLRDQEIPKGWGLASQKNKSKKELLQFLKNHGVKI